MATISLDLELSLHLQGYQCSLWDPMSILMAPVDQRGSSLTSKDPEVTSGSLDDPGHVPKSRPELGPEPTSKVPFTMVGIGGGSHRFIYVTIGTVTVTFLSLLF